MNTQLDYFYNLFLKNIQNYSALLAAQAITDGKDPDNIRYHVRPFPFNTQYLGKLENKIPYIYLYISQGEAKRKSSAEYTHDVILHAQILCSFKSVGEIIQEEDPYYTYWRSKNVIEVLQYLFLSAPSLSYGLYEDSKKAKLSCMEFLGFKYSYMNSGEYENNTNNAFFTLVDINLSVDEEGYTVKGKPLQGIDYTIKKEN